MGRHLRQSVDSDEQPLSRPTSPAKRRRSLLTPFRGRIASSKADIFEAKVASAVGEAASSDSEETFVYESNPLEPHSSRPSRFHSRTPSAASIVSQLDYHKNRPDGHHSLAGKKSMKFANNYSSMNYLHDGDGTVRGPGQAGRGNIGHHHIGRHGRGGYPSLFDRDSPFSHAQKAHRAANNAPSRSSPKTGHFFKSNPAKREENSSYDLEGEGADDEETPLIGTPRAARGRRRPIPGSVRHMYMSKETQSRYCGRVTTLTILGSALTILIAAIIFILIMCSKPLVGIRIRDIRNVIASESELMLDLHVHAINPNLIAVQITDLDVNIFAKSKHVNAMGQQTIHALKPTSRARRPNRDELHSREGLPIVSDPEDIISHLKDGGVDEGTDPMDDDPATDSQTMLLGQIFSFDSPLSFDPSPFKRELVSSVGEVRLAKPGNHTEKGGSERWEHVLLHEFELIVRGVFRYSPPVSSMTRSVTVHGSVIVHPNEEAEDGNMRLTPTDPKPDVDPGDNVIVEPPLIRGSLTR